MHADEHVGGRCFGEERRVARGGLAGDDRRRASRAERGANLVQELACPLRVLPGAANATEAVDDHEAGLCPAHLGLHLVGSRGQALREEPLQGEHLDRISKQILVEEGEGAQVRDELVGGLGERGQDEDAAAGSRCGKGHLEGQRCLATPRWPDDEREGATR
jgi:hypothetical protein